MKTYVVEVERSYTVHEVAEVKMWAKNQTEAKTLAIEYATSYPHFFTDQEYTNEKNKATVIDTLEEVEEAEEDSDNEEDEGNT